MAYLQKIEYRKLKSGRDTREPGVRDSGRSKEVLTSAKATGSGEVALQEAQE